MLVLCHIILPDFLPAPFPTSHSITVHTSEVPLLPRPLPRPAACLTCHNLC